MPDVIVVEDQNPEVIIVGDENVTAEVQDQNVFVDVLAFDIIVFEMIVGAIGAPAGGSTSFQLVDRNNNPIRGRRLQFFRDGAFMHRTVNYVYDEDAATVSILDAELNAGEPLEIWMFKKDSIIAMRQLEMPATPYFFESQFETQFE
jgi:hypothetical protein